MSFSLSSGSGGGQHVALTSSLSSPSPAQSLLTPLIHRLLSPDPAIRTAHIRHLFTNALQSPHIDVLLQLLPVLTHLTHDHTFQVRLTAVSQLYPLCLYLFSWPTMALIHNPNTNTVSMQVVANTNTTFFASRTFSNRSGPGHQSSSSKSPSSSYTGPSSVPQQAPPQAPPPPVPSTLGASLPMVGEAIESIARVFRGRSLTPASTVPQPTVTAGSLDISQNSHVPAHSIATQPHDGEDLPMGVTPPGSTHLHPHVSQHKTPLINGNTILINGLDCILTYILPLYPALLADPQPPVREGALTSIINLISYQTQHKQAFLSPSYAQSHPRIVHQHQLLRDTILSTALTLAHAQVPFPQLQTPRSDCTVSMGDVFRHLKEQQLSSSSQSASSGQGYDNVNVSLGPAPADDPTSPQHQPPAMLLNPQAQQQAQTQQRAAGLLLLSLLSPYVPLPFVSNVISSELCAFSDDMDVSMREFAVTQYPLIAAYAGSTVASNRLISFFLTLLQDVSWKVKRAAIAYTPGLLRSLDTLTVYRKILPILGHTMVDGGPPHTRWLRYESLKILPQLVTVLPLLTSGIVFKYILTASREQDVEVITSLAGGISAMVASCISHPLITLSNNERVRICGGGKQRVIHCLSTYSPQGYTYDNIDTTANIFSNGPRRKNQLNGDGFFDDETDNNVHVIVGSVRSDQSNGHFDDIFAETDPLYLLEQHSAVVDYPQLSQVYQNEVNRVKALHQQHLSQYQPFLRHINHPLAIKQTGLPLALSLQQANLLTYQDIQNIKSNSTANPAKFFNSLSINNLNLTNSNTLGMITMNNTTTTTLSPTLGVDDTIATNNPFDFITVTDPYWTLPLNTEPNNYITPSTITQLCFSLSKTYLKAIWFPIVTNNLLEPTRYLYAFQQQAQQQAQQKQAQGNQQQQQQQQSQPHFISGNTNVFGLAQQQSSLQQLQQAQQQQSMRGDQGPPERNQNPFQKTPHQQSQQCLYDLHQTLASSLPSIASLIPPPLHQALLSHVTATLSQQPHALRRMITKFGFLLSTLPIPLRILILTNGAFTSLKMAINHNLIYTSYLSTTPTEHNSNSQGNHPPMPGNAGGAAANKSILASWLVETPRSNQQPQRWYTGANGQTVSTAQTAQPNLVYTNSNATHAHGTLPFIIQQNANEKQSGSISSPSLQQQFHSHYNQTNMLNQMGVSTSYTALNSSDQGCVVECDSVDTVFYSRGALNEIQKMQQQYSQHWYPSVSAVKWFGDNGRNSLFSSHHSPRDSHNANTDEHLPDDDDDDHIRHFGGKNTNNRSYGGGNVLNDLNDYNTRKTAFLNHGAGSQPYPHGPNITPAQQFGANQKQVSLKDFFDIDLSDSTRYIKTSSPQYYNSLNTHNDGNKLANSLSNGNQNIVSNTNQKSKKSINQNTIDSTENYINEKYTIPLYLKPFLVYQKELEFNHNYETNTTHTTLQFKCNYYDDSLSLFYDPTSFDYLPSVASHSIFMNDDDDGGDVESAHNSRGDTNMGSENGIDGHNNTCPSSCGSDDSLEDQITAALDAEEKTRIKDAKFQHKQQLFVRNTRQILSQHQIPILMNDSVDYLRDTTFPVTLQDIHNISPSTNKDITQRSRISSYSLPTFLTLFGTQLPPMTVIYHSLSEDYPSLFSVLGGWRTRMALVKQLPLLLPAVLGYDAYSEAIHRDTIQEFHLEAYYYPQQLLFNPKTQKYSLKILSYTRDQSNTISSQQQQHNDILPINNTTIDISRLIQYNNYIINENQDNDHIDKYHGLILPPNPFLRFDLPPTALSLLTMHYISSTSSAFPYRLRLITYQLLPLLLSAAIAQAKKSCVCFLIGQPNNPHLGNKIPNPFTFSFKDAAIHANGNIQSEEKDGKNSKTFAHPHGCYYDEFLPCPCLTYTYTSYYPISRKTMRANAATQASPSHLHQQLHSFNNPASPQGHFSPIAAAANNSYLSQQLHQYQQQQKQQTLNQFATPQILGSDEDQTTASGVNKVPFIEHIDTLSKKFYSDDVHVINPDNTNFGKQQGYLIDTRYIPANQLSWVLLLCVLIPLLPPHYWSQHVCLECDISSNNESFIPLYDTSEQHHHYNMILNTVQKIMTFQSQPKKDIHTDDDEEDLVHQDDDDDDSEFFIDVNTVDPLCNHTKVRHLPLISLIQSNIYYKPNVHGKLLFLETALNSIATVDTTTFSWLFLRPLSWLLRDNTPSVRVKALTVLNALIVHIETAQQSFGVCKFFAEATKAKKDAEQELRPPNVVPLVKQSLNDPIKTTPPHNEIEDDITPELPRTDSLSGAFMKTKSNLYDVLYNDSYTFEEAINTSAQLIPPQIKNKREKDEKAMINSSNITPQNSNSSNVPLPEPSLCNNKSIFDTPCKSTLHSTCDNHASPEQNSQQNVKCSCYLCIRNPWLENSIIDSSVTAPTLLSTTPITTTGSNTPQSLHNHCKCIHGMFLDTQFLHTKSHPYAAYNNINKHLEDEFLAAYEKDNATPNINNSLTLSRKSIPGPHPSTVGGTGTNKGKSVSPPSSSAIASMLAQSKTPLTKSSSSSSTSSPSAYPTSSVLYSDDDEEPHLTTSDLRFGSDDDVRHSPEEQNSKQAVPTTDDPHSTSPQDVASFTADSPVGRELLLDTSGSPTPAIPEPSPAAVAQPRKSRDWFKTIPTLPSRTINRRTNHQHH